MIQFNLLPDVKLEYVKAQRIKHAVISGAVIASGAAFLIFVLLFVAVHVVQKQVIANQTTNITKYNQDLLETKDIDKILTVQNQLGVLSGLHAAKPVAKRNFALIQQLTPLNVSLNNFTVDYVTKKIEISGVALTLDQVNTMTDTVKYATYRNSKVTGKSAFSEVVLSEFSRSSKNTTFKISATYDPVIFDNADEVTFSVPNSISTPSVLGTLFSKPATGNGN